MSVATITIVVDNRTALATSDTICVLGSTYTLAFVSENEDTNVTGATLSIYDTFKRTIVAQSEGITINLNTNALAKGFSVERKHTPVPTMSFPFAVTLEDGTVAWGMLQIRWNPGAVTIDGKPITQEGPRGPKGDPGGLVNVDGLYAFHISAPDEYPEEAYTNIDAFNAGRFDLLPDGPIDHTQDNTPHPTGGYLYLHAQDVNQFYAKDVTGRTLWDKPFFTLNADGCMYYNFYDNGNLVQRVNLGRVKGDKGDRGDPGPRGAPGEAPELPSYLSQENLNLTYVTSVALGQRLTALRGELENTQMDEGAIRTIAMDVVYGQYDASVTQPNITRLDGRIDNLNEALGDALLRYTSNTNPPEQIANGLIKFNKGIKIPGANETEFYAHFDENNILRLIEYVAIDPTTSKIYCEAIGSEVGGSGLELGGGFFALHNATGVGITTLADGQHVVITTPDTDGKAYIDEISTEKQIATLGDLPEPICVDAALSSTSTNPVQSKAIYSALNQKVSKSELSGYVRKTGDTMTGPLVFNYTQQTADITIAAGISQGYGGYGSSYGGDAIIQIGQFWSEQSGYGYGYGYGSGTNLEDVYLSGLSLSFTDDIFNLPIKEEGEEEEPEYYTAVPVSCYIQATGFIHYRPFSGNSYIGAYNSFYDRQVVVIDFYRNSQGKLTLTISGGFTLFGQHTYFYLTSPADYDLIGDGQTVRFQLYTYGEESRENGYRYSPNNVEDAHHVYLSTDESLRREKIVTGSAVAQSELKQLVDKILKSHNLI